LRIAAEWEPALGALISWPLHIPSALVVELARDDQLFVMVESANQQSQAEASFEDWGIDLSVVTFIVAPNGDVARWTRDWGPHALFDTDMGYHLADPVFLDYPRSDPPCDDALTPGGFDAENDDQAPGAIADLLGFDHLELPFILTGGNVMHDGHGRALSACVMTNENGDFGLSEDEYFELTETHIGVTDYAITSNFEAYGIQHIDCLLKLLDEERILVARTPPGHESEERYETVVEELTELTNAYGRPYKILRLDTAPYSGSLLAAYMNSLVLNKRIYVPLYGIDQDDVALQTFEEAMPGYEVLGFAHTNTSSPWRANDALHCRVRAIWDPEMLYMTHKRIEEVVSPEDEYPIDAQILDYSKAGFEDDSLKLKWRLAGEDTWQEIQLEPTSVYGNFTVEIPGAQSGRTVEYFLEAADKSGRQEALPRTAPSGYYSFNVE
jgi:agmatine/peptidylarginine deiminase